MHSITQDTFSFSLVLLCLAVGDIAFVRKRGRAIARTAYATGFRYKVPKSLRKACPEIAALIKEMWLTDFRARPAMKDVVVRLEACVSVEGVVNEESSILDEHSLETTTAREQQLELEIASLKERIRLLEMTSE